MLLKRFICLEYLKVDATAQSEIACEALKRLTAAVSVKGALKGHELRGLALRLANHGELTRLSGLVNNLVTLGLGREAAFAAAVLGDNALMEKAWQDTGMLAEAVLHAHAHGRPTLKNLVQAWNQMLQREMEPASSQKTDAAAAFFSFLEDIKLKSLAEAGKKPPIEILPPGMVSLSVPAPLQKKPAFATQNSQKPLGKPLALEAPPAATTGEPPSAPPAQQSESTPPAATTAEPPSAPLAQQSESTPAPVTDSSPSQSATDSQPDSVAAAAASQPESGETNVVEKEASAPASANAADQTASGETVQSVTTSSPAPIPTLNAPTGEPPKLDESQDTNIPTAVSIANLFA